MNKRRLEIEFRLSEIRSAMNSGKLDNADLTDAKRAELQVEHGKLETEFRVLVTAELKAASAPKVEADDGEAAEHRALLGRVEVRQYLSAAATGTELRGAEAELNSALKLEARAGTILPWEALAPVEERADAITQAPADTGVRQRSIVSRVFAQTAAAHLGVQMPSVGVGESMFVYLSGGTSPAQRAEGARGDATAATFATKTFKPKRLEARYVFGVEDLATLAGMESALRADLRGALGEAMDATIIGLGGAQIRGLLATAANGGLAAFADPAAVVNATTMISTLLSPLDGRNATTEGEIRYVVGPATYRKLAAIVAGDRYVFADYKPRVRVSAHIPDATNANVQQLIASTTRGPVMVAPVWQGVELLRDPFTQMDTGRVRVQATALWDFGIVRESGASRLKFDLA